MKGFSENFWKTLSTCLSGDVVETIDYNLQHVCGNCIQVYADHIHGKCLYEPTWFMPVDCVACKTPDDFTYVTAVVDKIRYFMCHNCVAEHVRTNELYTKRFQNNEFFKRFIRDAIYVSTWRCCSEY